MLCSEWVPSEWESKQLIKTSTSNPHHTEKVFWSESGEKSASDQAAFTRQNSSKLICGWILMKTGDALFHWRKSYYGLWTHILMLDLFQLLSSPDVNWWTGVVWITCGLLWCFYQLFGLSFWRHPFTAEHPLLRHWCRDTFLQTWWRNKLILILDDLRGSTISANLHYWVNCYFNKQWNN